MDDATHTDILGQAQSWRQNGNPVALATVVRTWGSSPRPVGSHLAVNAAGDFAGSVSGGCIEGAVIETAQAALADGKPRLIEFGVSDERAWEVGLACGGRVQVFVEALGAAFDRMMAARRDGSALAQVTRLADGAQALVRTDGAEGELQLTAEQIAAARGLLERHAADGSGMLDEADGLFARIHVPAPRLVIVGAVHIAQTLAPMAALAGFDVTVVDPRRAFAREERFPGIALTDDWPDDAMRRLAPDAGTAVVTLSHDPKIDDPALIVALASPAYYIGALGSRRTHAKRLERLAAAGLAEACRRIRAPVGLDLGGRTPPEIAVAILAEMVSVRYGNEKGRAA